MEGPNLFSLLTLFIGLFIGNRIRVGSEAASRRRIFRNCISCIMEDVRGAEAQDLKQVHRDSVVKIKTESTNIKEDIHLWNRRKFDAAWRAYCDTTAKDFSKTNEWIADLSKTPSLEFDYRLVRDELLRELELILKFAV
jgi:hypothetical protein